ncbi:MAG: hypothetical protein ACI4RC_03835 [Oscillospiraceae bacterium]
MYRCKDNKGIVWKIFALVLAVVDLVLVAKAVSCIFSTRLSKYYNAEDI